MGPTYAIVAGLSVLTLSGLRSRTGTGRSRPWIRFAVAVPAAILVIVAAALPTFFPVFTFPKPAGPYGIGTAEYELKNGPDGRDLVIQTWYPATADAQGSRAGITSRPELLETAYASFTGLPTPLFQNLRFVKTHAIQNAALAADQARFPVVLFSHGPLSANRAQSVFQMEALASHGFIVVAIDHTGYASTTIFPDGHTVPPAPEATWPVFVDARSTAMLNDLGRRRAIRDRPPRDAEYGRFERIAEGATGPLPYWLCGRVFRRIGRGPVVARRAEDQSWRRAGREAVPLRPDVD